MDQFKKLSSDREEKLELNWFGLFLRHARVKCGGLRCTVVVLSTVKKTVRTHEDKILVESEKDEERIVCFELPGRGVGSA